MKILFFSRLYYPHIGGIENHLKKLSLRLIKKGHDVVILTTKFENRLKDKETKNNIKIVRFYQPRIKFVGLLYTWLWIFKHISLIKESEIVHIHDVFIWYLPFLAFLPRKKVFVTFHGRWGKYPIPWADMLQKKIAAKLSSGVISIGKYIDKNYGIKSDVISYGAVDIPKQFKKKENLLLYVGRLDNDTALSIFLNMLHYYHTTVRGSNARVIFCGDGELRNECEKYGKVLGWVDPSQYYAKARFVFASGYLTVLEGFANKCLVFACYKDNLQEDYYKLTPFRNYLIIAPNSNELYKKLKYYSKNVKDTEKLIKESYNWAIGQSWDSVISSYLRLWKLK